MYEMKIVNIFFNCINMYVVILISKLLKSNQIEINQEVNRFVKLFFVYQRVLRNDDFNN